MAAYSTVHDCRIVLLSDVNDTDWVDGNTMPQLMSHGAGNNIYFSHILYPLIYTVSQKNVPTLKRYSSKL